MTNSKFARSRSLMTPLRSLTSAMFRGFIRDRMSLFWTVAFPMMFLVLFGGLLDTGSANRVQVLQVGEVQLLDQMPAEARESIAEFVQITVVDGQDEALEELRLGDVAGVIAESGPTLQLWYSQADQVISSQVIGTFSGIVDAGNLAVAGVEPIFNLETQQVEDESLQAIQFVTPGILGWAVALSASFGASLNLVAWRKNGLLRRLRLAPIPTSSVVLARVGVSLVIALVQAAIFIGVAVGAFGLRLSSTSWLVVPLVLAGTLAFLSIGLLVGAISKTEEAAAGLSNFIILPMAFLSGSFFSIEAMPRWLQSVSQFLPLRHLNDAMLDVMVRDEGASAVVMPIAILLAFTAVLTAVAAKLFRWDS